MIEETIKMLRSLVDLIQDGEEDCHLNLNIEFKEGKIMESFYSIGVKHGMEIPDLTGGSVV